MRQAVITAEFNCEYVSLDIVLPHNWKYMLDSQQEEYVYQEICNRRQEWIDKVTVDDYTWNEDSIHTDPELLNLYDNTGVMLDHTDPNWREEWDAFDDALYEAQEKGESNVRLQNE